MTSSTPKSDPPKKRKKGRMGLFSKVSEQYGELWKAIIRPPRDHYSPMDLGPPMFPIMGNVYERTDFQLTNARGLTLVCSHFQPRNRPAEQLPCVIYLHGNCSSRVESLGCLHILLPLHITVLGFDFSGSGLSDGEFVSLGWHERDDLAIVIDHLRQSGSVSCIGLWGRSMGAVTALLHGDRDPSIAGMILDSPFTSLRKLAEELTDHFVGWKIPKFLVGAVMNMLRNTILQKAQFDIDLLAPINHVKHTFVPAVFVAAKSDAFIHPHHSRELHDAYAGDKNIIEVEGDHNSMRPGFLIDSAGIFFYGALQCRQIPGADLSKCHRHHPAVAIHRALAVKRQQLNALNNGNNRLEMGKEGEVGVVGERQGGGSGSGMRPPDRAPLMSLLSYNNDNNVTGVKENPRSGSECPFNDLRSNAQSANASSADGEMSQKGNPPSTGLLDLEGVDEDALFAAAMAAEGITVRDFDLREFANEPPARNSSSPTSSEQRKAPYAALHGGIEMRPPDLPCHFVSGEDGLMRLVLDADDWEDENEEDLVQHAIQLSLENSDDCVNESNE